MRALQRLANAVIAADIADVEFQLGVVERRTHLLLLLLVAAKDAYLGNLGCEKTFQDVLPE